MSSRVSWIQDSAIIFLPTQLAKARDRPSLFKVQRCKYFVELVTEGSPCVLTMYCATMSEAMLGCRLSGRYSFSARLRNTNAKCRRLYSERQQKFYGQPRQVKEYRSAWSKTSIALHAATTAFWDPTRADAVATLAETTSEVSLRRMLHHMRNDPTGRRLLEERPLVTKSTIPYNELISNAPDNLVQKDLSFGEAYGFFLKLHGFDPDERVGVRYIDDPELRWVMLRYRQVSLLNLRPTLPLCAFTVF